MFLLVLIFSSGLIIGSIIGIVLSNEKINNLESRVTDLQTENTFLKNNETDLQSQITYLNQQIESKNNEINACQIMISQLKKQLDYEGIGVFFSPNGGCENQILQWINRANQSLHILIYSFTLDSIGDALIEAHNRRIKVEVVFEVRQISQYSEYQRLRLAGLSVRNDTNSQSMHNKVMIIDESYIATGSFNWSTNGEKNNNENLIIIKSDYLSGVYEEEFNKIWNNSQV